MISNNNVATSYANIINCTVTMPDNMLTYQSHEYRQGWNEDGSMNGYVNISCDIDSEIADATALMVLITDNPDVNENWIWQTVDTVNNMQFGSGTSGEYSMLFDLNLTPELAEKDTLTAYIYALNAKGLSEPYRAEFHLIKPDQYRG